MNRKLSFLLIVVALLSLILAAWAGGGMLWGRLLEMHGMAPASASSAIISKSWPTTRAGTLARLWVEAFNSGEAEMRLFLERNMAPEKLRERGVEKRIVTYRDLRTRYGALKLTGVTRSEPFQIDARLTARDGVSRTFVFEVDDEQPHNLQAVKILENRSHAGR